MHKSAQIIASVRSHGFTEWSDNDYGAGWQPLDTMLMPGLEWPDVCLMPQAPAELTLFSDKERPLTMFLR